jgi:hypothetical protein
MLENSELIFVFAIILLFFGLHNLYLLYKHIRRLRASRNWPETRGKVSESQVLYKITENRRQHTIYYSVMEYSYQVLGTEYNGKVQIDNSSGSAETAYKAAKAFPTGGSFSLRYNPENPQEHITQQLKLKASHLFDVAFPLAVGLGIIIYFLVLK